MTPETPRDGSVLDAAQQQRILAAVLDGPMVELLRKVVRRLPPRPDKAVKEAEYALTTERGLQPMRLDLPASHASSPSGMPWPATQLTWDDRSRLTTVSNVTKLPLTHVLHHAVVFTHHVFRSLMLEVMETHERTGTPVRDLLGAVIEGVGEEPALEDAAQGTFPAGDPDAHPRSAIAHALPAPAAGERAPHAPASPFAGTAAEADPTRPFPDPLPLPPMPRPTGKPKPNRAPGADQIERLEEQIESLEHEMALLRDSMDVLRTAVDELREELVHALRNPPEPLPPPLHIHSLSLDPTSDDFGERINAVPADVMAKLRAEAATQGGEIALTAAAEGRPDEPSVLDGGNGRTHASGRQGRLFG